MMMKKFLVPIAMIAICVYGCVENTATREPESYSVMEVDTSDIEIQTLYPASINGRQDIDIYPKISGFIEKVSINEGQKVKKGQTLFIIEQIQYQAALQTAKANVEAAKASVATTRLTYDSKKELFDRKVISQYELTTAENQLLTAKAQLSHAEAQEIDARNNLSYTIVKSPANGIVGTIPYREGTLVSPSMPQALTTVSDNSSMFVYFSLGESQLLDLLRNYGTAGSALENMPQIELMLSDGKKYEHPGRIETISGVIDPTTGSASIRAVFPNPDQLLRSGGAGNVVIPTSFTDAIVIPQNVTFEVQDKFYVFKAENGRASQTMITVSKFNNGREFIVESGLAPRDRIVSEGVGLLRDGTEIRIKQEGGN